MSTVTGLEAIDRSKRRLFGRNAEQKTKKKKKKKKRRDIWTRSETLRRGNDGTLKDEEWWCGVKFMMLQINSNQSGKGRNENMPNL